MLRPVELGPNQPKQFYRGGGAITAFRGRPSSDEFRPEDWVASTTPRFGLEPDGLTRLPDGRYLRDAVEEDPEGWLGPAHLRYFGPSTALLVKLLDAGQRLPVHLHPPRSFAYRHLGSRHGKTEAWVVLSTTGAEPSVYLGWSRDVDGHELARWVAEQDAPAMLATMNKLVVRPGDAVLVPAGTAHAIGEGVFSLELQEPTDFSIMLELEGFGFPPGTGDLGLGRDLALSCVQRRAFDEGRLSGLRKSFHPAGRAPSTAQDVLPGAADAYFRAQRAGGGTTGLEPSFAVVVGIAGSGSLYGDDWRLPVGRGVTIAVPWSAGVTGIDGDADLLRCLPPLPSAASTDDPRGS